MKRLIQIVCLCFCHVNEYMTSTSVMFVKWLEVGTAMFGIFKMKGLWYEVTEATFRASIAHTHTTTEKFHKHHKQIFIWVHVLIAIPMLILKFRSIHKSYNWRNAKKKIIIIFVYIIFLISSGSLPINWISLKVCCFHFKSSNTWVLERCCCCW